MHHNEQIHRFGVCRCRCHENVTTLYCRCGWLKRFPRRPLRTKVRSEKLTSRVKPFQRSGARRLPIAVTRLHYVHQPKDVRP